MRTQPQDIIARLEADNSRLAKEAVLAEAMTEGLDEFFEGIKMCLDTLYTFGVKKVPEATVDGQGLAWSVFNQLAHQLNSRELTGHAARDAIQLAMEVATVEQWNGFYRRILIKDLRCGVSEKTVNNVAKKLKKPQYSVPVFSCQLAHDSANHESKVTGEKIVEVKLDGVRVITIAYPDGNVVQFSRNGKEFHNFEHIKEQISKVKFTESMVLDGEVMSSSFQDLMKQVHRKDNVEAGDAVLHLFDIVPLSEFNKGSSTKTQLTRSQELADWYNTHKDVLPNVEILDYEILDLNTDKGTDRFQEINKLAIAGGYEGIMIKDVDAVYECKRTHSWLKLKPFIEVTLEVQGVEQGTGRNESRLGALVCSGTDDGKEIQVNVGSGFSDDDRQTFWDSRNSLIGHLVEVRADAITQNQDGTFSLRFPRFLRFRGFDIGDKL
jgi:DNA ligase-1